MVFKLVNATEVRAGTAILINNEPSIIKSVDISKTGKHGHAKVRIEAIGIFDNKKKLIVVPGHERLEIPLIKKSKAQVLSIQGDRASLMDLENFETLTLTINKEVVGEINEGDNIEYWDIDGKKIIRRKI